jgi:ribonuclease HII
VLIAGQSIIKRQSRAGEQLSLRSSAQRPPGQLPKPAQPASSTGTSPAAPTHNVLEQRMATRLIRLAPPCTSIVAEGQVLFRPLEAHVPTLRAVNHADDTEPSVMAAAIVAKVERDRLLAAIDKTSASLCGFIPRKGYPGRETTAWLARYQVFFRTLPPDARNTWGRSRAH